MIKYRVYVKKAMEVINFDLESGQIDDNGQNIPNSGNRKDIRTVDYISLDDDLLLHLLIDNWSFTEVNFYFYDSNKEYIDYIVERNFEKLDLEPAYSNAQYVRFSLPTLHNSGGNVLAVNYTDVIVIHKKNKPVLLHDSSIPEKEYHLINANLHLEDSVAGSLEFVLTKHHPYYSQKIELLTDTLYITRTYKDGSEHIIWDGRAISEDVDNEGSLLYHCEGALSYLNDTRTISHPNVGESYITISDFINSFILYPLNVQNKTGTSDRFFHYLNGNTYDEYSDINIRNNKTYSVFTSYDSGIKLLEDFKDSFGAHFKVKYGKSSDVTNDSIYRCLTGIIDFNGKVPIKRIYIQSNGYPVSYQNAETSDSKNAAWIFPHEYFYIGGDNPSSLSNVYVFKSNVRFNCSEKESSIDSFITRYTDTYNQYITELSLEEKEDLFTIDDSDDYAEVDDYGIVKRLYISTIANRVPHLKASFGLNIFSAKKTTEISDFATRIIPKGIECELGTGERVNLVLNDSSITIDGTTHNFTQDELAPDTKYRSGAKLSDYELIKKYGVIEAVVNFEEADTPKKLYYQGLTWFRELKKNIVRRNVEISLYDLTRAITYDSTITNIDDLLADPEYLDIWTQIEATIPELGITEDDPEKYYISALDIPLDNWIETQVSLVNTAELLSKQRVDAGYVLGSSKGIIDTSS